MTHDEAEGGMDAGHLTTNEVPPKGISRRKLWKTYSVIPAVECSEITKALEVGSLTVL